MHLTPREQERLLIAAGADLARRRVARGAPLGVAESIALVCDEVLEAAWDGASLEEAIEAGRRAVPPEALLPGVPALAPAVQLEALFPFGSVLVHIDSPFGAVEDDAPGAVRAATGQRELAAGRPRAEATLTNAGEASVWVSSHYPLDALNDAVRVEGLPEGRWRLDLPAGVCRELTPGVPLTVRVVQTGPTPSADTDTPGPTSPAAGAGA
ncbi:MAG: urease subunit gamma [Micrococcales bacterium]|nr:urease subunit gamma [Micrococcales bacterium]